MRSLTHNKKTIVIIGCYVFSIWLIFAVFLLLTTSNLFAKAIISLESPVNHVSWKQFMRLSDSQFTHLWSQRHLSYESLDWSWRVAFLTRCKYRQAQICQPVIIQALRDRAAIVRAEAAKVIKYPGVIQDKQKIIDELVASYNSFVNTHKGSKFVYEHILSTLYLLDANNIGFKLAYKDPIMLVYWNKLTTQ